SHAGRPVLAGKPRECFGVSGAAWVLRFRMRGGEHYFGSGEKWGQLEKSGVSTYFWNTAVWARFDPAAIRRGDADPVYGSVPYLVVERTGKFVGILVHSAFPVFIEVPAGRPKLSAGFEPKLTIGATQGPVRVYFLVGPSLAELTRKLQCLVGRTPRPPLWALGHHQSRWGYAGTRDLLTLDAAFRRHRFPCDGLWL